MADHHDLPPFSAHLRDLDMDLGHQRTGGVEDAETARLRFLLHGLAHTVGRKHQGRARGHVGQFLDEDRALGLEVVDDIGVVHDLVAHIDRPAELGQRAFDDLDRAVHAGAETARFGQDDFFRLVHHSTPINCTSKRTGWPASGWLKSNSTAPSSRTSTAEPA